MTKKLSIIIPVYNGEKYIQKCLESIYSQLDESTEVIIIDDGSTDNTLEIIFGLIYAGGKDSSFKVISVPNGGVSLARNIGLDNATGEYLSFVDADDIVTPNYISVINEAIESKPSIIEFGFRMIDLQGKIIVDNFFLHNNFGMHSALSLIDTVFAKCIWYPVLRVFQKELFHELRFPVGVRFCEDLMTLSQAYKRAISVFALSQVLYEYRINSAGATLNIKPDYAENLIDFYRSILKDNNFSDQALKINLAYAIRRCTAVGTQRFGKMPPDIEKDVKKLMFSPRLFLRIKTGLVVRAIFSPIINTVMRTK